MLVGLIAVLFLAGLVLLGIGIAVKALHLLIIVGAVCLIGGFISAVSKAFR
jgi:hypothetical protein